MAARANWRGFLKVGEVSCPVGLYTAASTSDRIAFHTLNRKTGNRLRRVFVDSETGDPVDRDEQVKGYEIASGEYIVLDPEEVASAVPDSDKTLSVTAFIGCDDIDDLYFDKPYYLLPTDEAAEEAFALIREGMRGKKVAALGACEPEVILAGGTYIDVKPHEAYVDGTMVSAKGWTGLAAFMRECLKVLGTEIRHT